MNYHVSVMAVILNLFAPAVWQSLVSSSVAAGAAPADASIVDDAPVRRQVLGWCVGCPLAEVCDSDQCADRPESDNSFYRRIQRFNSQF